MNRLNTELDFARWQTDFWKEIYGNQANELRNFSIERQNLRLHINPFQIRNRIQWIQIQIIRLTSLNQWERLKLNLIIIV